MKKITQEVEFQKEEIGRYARHLSLKEVGMQGQKLLKASSVLCVGSGGLGSPVLMYLAAAGIGKIGIIDFDLVESSNLQRQIIHGSSWIGKPKAESARERILEINPYCKVDIYKEVLNKDNAIKIINSYDIICDCTDNFPSRYLINDACIILKKTNVYGSIAGFEGHITVFNLDNESPNLRDLIPEPPPLDLLPNCSDGGVLGVLPGVIGVIQATEIIKIITQIGTTLSGRLLIFDALSMKFKELHIKASKKNKDINKLVEYQGFCFDKKTQLEKYLIKNISVQDLKKIIANNAKDYILIDVRSLKEHENNSIRGSKVFPLERIENGQDIPKLKEISKDQIIYAYCKTGRRSLKAIIKLKQHQIDGINVIGGMDEWNHYGVT